MSFEVPKRSRKPSCTLCSNHGIRSDLKGHKYHCEFSDCECKLCDRGRVRREVMRKQVKLRRHQMRQIFAAKSDGNINEVKLDSPPQRMIPAMNFKQQSSAPMCDVSPGYSTFPRFPTRVIPYTQSHQSTATETMAAAFFINMPPVGLSPQSTHSPLHRLSPATSRLRVSDNSAFVRFSPQSNAIHEAISNAWPGTCEVVDPKEAAYALASLQHKTNKLRLK